MDMGHNTDTSNYDHYVLPVTGRVITHIVVDNHTKAVMSKHTNLRSAHRKADRLDLQYGAIRYIVRRV